MYRDEEIIDMRNQWDNENRSDIYTGFFIEGELIEFEEKELFNGELRVMLPKKFVEMPMKMKRVKYPSDNRPKIIKTDLQGKINMTFNILNLKMTDKSTEEAMAQMKKITQRLMPHYKFGNDFLGQTKNGLYFGYEYISNVLDGKMYNFVYGVCMNGKLMNGACNCLAQDKHWWEKAFIQICESILVIDVTTID